MSEQERVRILAANCPMDKRCRESGGCVNGHSGLNDLCEIQDWQDFEDRSNALQQQLREAETERVRLETALREIFPHVQRFVENLDYEYECEEWLTRNAALTSTTPKESSSE